MDIKVVYNAKGRGRTRAVRIPPRGRPRRRVWLWTIGLFHLMLAGAAYYGMWWELDKEVRLRLLLHTPVSAGSTGFGSFSILAPNSEDVAGAAPGQAWTVNRGNRENFDAAFLVGSTMGWQLLATVSICTLALSGGAMLGSAGSPRLRAVGALLSLVTAIALAGGIFYVWREYDVAFKVSHLRKAIGGVVLLSAGAGVALARWPRGLSRLAAGMLIVSSVATVVALYIGLRYEAVKPDELPVPFWLFVGLAFVVQSLWGWLLLPISSRLR